MPKSVWDTIYKDYEKDGKAWASLKDGIHPLFISFLKQSKFGRKSVFDLGCGNGKYLEFLQKVGFEVSGIDSSPTAIRMAQKSLGKNVKLKIADMYLCEIPEGIDLIISIAAIQHHTKPAIAKLVSRVYKSLSLEGNFFITFPRLSMASRWNTFKDAKQIAPGTFVPIHGPEKGLVHSFYEKEELAKLFSNFENVKIIKDDMGRWVVQGKK
ncbi:MAG: class I SAM-dependent methyltransferase [Candidatus Taylorbacteria bacterium]|nr:class I SAM-dependent methyltransferase [Candidatus Taylorbacteria bacterium]